MILTGGLGTRLLPASKAVPKSLLPVLDGPMIQLGVEELVSSGIRDIIFVVGPDMEAIQRHFSENSSVDRAIDSRSITSLDNLNQIISQVKFTFIVQDQPLGTGHAVLLTKPVVNDEPFLVVLPDDVVQTKQSPLPHMLKQFDSLNASIISAFEVPRKEVNRYGIIRLKESHGGHWLVEEVVEKPSPRNAPSNMAIMGLYLLTPAIFSCLERTPPGVSDEIWLTDAISILLKEQPLYAHLFDGERHDGGTILGLLRMSIEKALRDKGVQKEVLHMLKELVQVYECQVRE